MPYKYGKCTRQHNSCNSETFFPRRETVAAEENRFAAELTEDEVIKLLENATPGNTEKATKYVVKIFQGIYLYISIFTNFCSHNSVFTCCD